MSVALVCLSVLVPAFLLGFLGGRFVFCLWALLYVPIVLIAAAVADEVLIVLAVPVAVVVAALMIAIGVAAGRAARPHSSAVVASLIGGVALFSLARRRSVTSRSTARCEFIARTRS